MVCESRTSTVSNPQTVLKVCVVVQNAYHELPVNLQEQRNFDLRSQSAKVLPSSPTAVQRLAKLSASSLNVGGSHPASSNKKHAHKRKKVGCSHCCFICKHSSIDHFGCPRMEQASARRLVAFGILKDFINRHVSWPITGDTLFDSCLLGFCRKLSLRR